MNIIIVTQRAPRPGFPQILFVTRRVCELMEDQDIADAAYGECRPRGCVGVWACGRLYACVRGCVGGGGG